MLFESLGLSSAFHGLSIKSRYVLFITQLRHLLTISRRGGSGWRIRNADLRLCQLRCETSSSFSARRASNCIDATHVFLCEFFEIDRRDSRHGWLHGDAVVRSVSRSTVGKGRRRPWCPWGCNEQWRSSVWFVVDRGCWGPESFREINRNLKTLTGMRMIGQYLQYSGAVHRLPIVLEMLPFSSLPLQLLLRRGEECVLLGFRRWY